jgi:hypothetical protein
MYDSILAAFGFTYDAQLGRYWPKIGHGFIRVEEHIWVYKVAPYDTDDTMPLWVVGAKGNDAGSLAILLAQKFGIL